MTTTTRSEPLIVSAARARGKELAHRPPAALTEIVLARRAEFGALQDELNRAVRQAGRVFTGPAADALAEICRGLDALYVELRRSYGAVSVRDVAVAHWSERGEIYGIDHPCFACKRFPCACDLLASHVD